MYTTFTSAGQKLHFTCTKDKESKGLQFSIPFHFPFKVQTDSRQSAIRIISLQTFPSSSKRQEILQYYQVIKQRRHQIFAEGSNLISLQIAALQSPKYDRTGTIKTSSIIYEPPQSLLTGSDETARTSKMDALRLTTETLKSKASALSCVSGDRDNGRLLSLRKRPTSPSGLTRGCPFRSDVSAKAATCLLSGARGRIRVPT